MTHLDAIAVDARRMAAPIARRSYGRRKIDQQEYATLSQSAAFLAYVELGGDPDAPEAFAWDEQRRTLLRRTFHQLRALLTHTDLNAREELRRQHTRVPGAMNDDVRWDAWDSAMPITPERRGRRGRDQNTRVKFGQEYQPAIRQEDAALLAELGAALAEVLSTEDYTLLEQHYLEDVKQRDLAQAKGATETAINVRMHRARKRAEARLPEEWRDRARRCVGGDGTD